MENIVNSKIKRAIKSKFLPYPKVVFACPQSCFWNATIECKVIQYCPHPGAWLQDIHVFNAFFVRIKH